MISSNSAQFKDLIERSTEKQLCLLRSLMWYMVLHHSISKPAALSTWYLVCGISFTNFHDVELKRKDVYMFLAVAQAYLKFHQYHFSNIYIQKVEPYLAFFSMGVSSHFFTVSQKIFEARVIKACTQYSICFGIVAVEKLLISIEAIRIKVRRSPLFLKTR